jgi:uncharacterized membrane protein YfhO
VVAAGSPVAAASRVELEVLGSGGGGVQTAVTCDGRCLLTLARPWAPGWQALVDGRRHPVVRVNLAGLGVMVPAGRHRVELAYHPWRWAF